MTFKKFWFHVKHLIGNERGNTSIAPATLSEIPENPPAPTNTGSAGAAATPNNPLTPPPVDTAGMKSDDLKAVLEKTPKPAPAAKPAVTVDPSKPPVAAAGEQPKNDDQWFNKEKGWKTPEDAVKAHNEAMEKIRQQAEESKTLKQAEQARVQEELARLKKLEAERNLSPDEKEKQEAFKKWEQENKDALEMIEKGLLEKLGQKYDLRPKEEQIQSEILSSRQKWNEDFQKDESRKALWPHMDAQFKEAGGLDGLTQNFFKNPFPFLEAMAFQKNFASIAEKIRAEAIEAYKADVKKAEAAALQSRTERPGGGKSASGAVEVDKMTSAELSALLPRSDNG